MRRNNDVLKYYKNITCICHTLTFISINELEASLSEEESFFAREQCPLSKAQGKCSDNVYRKAPLASISELEASICEDVSFVQQSIGQFEEKGKCSYEVVQH